MSKLFTLLIKPLSLVIVALGVFAVFEKVSRKLCVHYAFCEIGSLQRLTLDFIPFLFFISILCFGILLLNKKGEQMLGSGMVIFFLLIASFLIVASNRPLHSEPSYSNARIKGSLVGIRVDGEIFFDRNHEYASTTIPVSSCYSSDAYQKSVFNQAGVRGAIEFAEGFSHASSTCAVSTAPPAWAASAKMKGEDFGYWCVDSTGAAKEVSRHITEAKCPEGVAR